MPLPPELDLWEVKLNAFQQSKLEDEDLSSQDCKCVSKDLIKITFVSFLFIH